MNVNNEAVPKAFERIMMEIKFGGYTQPPWAGFYVTKSLSVTRPTGYGKVTSPTNRQSRPQPLPDRPYLISFSPSYKTAHSITQRSRGIQESQDWPLGELDYKMGDIQVLFFCQSVFFF